MSRTIFARGAPVYLRYGGSVRRMLPDEPRCPEIASKGRNHLPALHGHYLVEMIPQLGCPETPFLRIAIEKQVFPLMANTSLVPWNHFESPRCFFDARTPEDLRR